MPTYVIMWTNWAASTQQDPGLIHPTTTLCPFGTPAAKSVHYTDPGREFTKLSPNPVKSLCLKHRVTYFWFITVSVSVALNFQTACTDIDLNQGRFLVNGKSGYILKPAYMRDLATEFDPITLTPGDWLKHKLLHVMVRISLWTHTHTHSGGIQLSREFLLWQISLMRYVIRLYQRNSFPKWTRRNPP